MTNYFQNQASIGANFCSGVQYQKDYSLGDLWATLRHVVLPISTPVAKAVGHQVLKVAHTLTIELLAGKPPGKTLAKRVHP